MRLRRPAISLAVSASLALGAGAWPAYADAPQAPGSQVQVKVGQAEGFSRIEFDGVQPRTLRRQGQDLVLTFGPAAPPDLSLLKVAPPRYLKTASVAQGPHGLELRLTLAEGVEAKVGRADGGLYVNLYPGASTPAPPDQTPSRTGDPVPASGVVRMHAGLDRGVLSLRFDWRAPVGAAVFRRGEAIWVVFDAKARLDLSELPEGLPQAKRVEVVASPDATALRIVAPAGISALATAQGASWTVALGPTAGAPPLPVTLVADPAGPGLRADLAGATGVFWLDDPSVGDRLAVVTAPGPPKGVLAGRRLVDADVLASVQGLALAPHDGDLAVTTDKEVVRVSRPSGLEISAGVPVSKPAPTPVSLPQPAALPALVDFPGWSAVGSQGFYARYQALQQAAGDEAAKGKTAPTQARFGFARFLVGSELAFEAIGELDLLAKTNPEVMGSPEFRGLRGAARAMAGRYKDAEADFSAPAVANDPASAVWRGYIASRLDDSGGARQAFAAGRAALPRFAPVWRARFLVAEGQAALRGGDTAGAGAALAAAAALQPQGTDGDRLALAQGQLQQALGHLDPALVLYQRAEASPYGGVSAPALLYATELQETQGRISPVDAAAALQSVSYRWRGDEVELDAARGLGRLYLAQGRYRDALGALRGAAQALPNLAGAAGVQQDLGGTFRTLFLDGGADGLPPVQALALFFDFKDLTPIGADGDQIVRKLAKRLVDVDLLDQAAELLKYQADNRLDGVARAQVDTDLALIQVMNRQPEAALDALNASRTTLLPNDLQSRRRVIQARALIALGRYDDAREILESDRSADAQDVRADLAWQTHDWPGAGKLLEVSLGPRFRSTQPLDAADSGKLLRAAIAYSLAGDQAGLARLRDRYGKLAEGSPDPNMLKVALAGTADGAASEAPTQALADADAFAGWVQAMKTRLLAPGKA
jgi:tetratricopeptide (TPR) repeat protein